MVYQIKISMLNINLSLWTKNITTESDLDLEITTDGILFSNEMSESTSTTSTISPTIFVESTTMEDVVETTTVKEVTSEITTLESKVETTTLKNDVTTNPFVRVITGKLKSFVSNSFLYHAVSHFKHKSLDIILTKPNFY